MTQGAGVVYHNYVQPFLELNEKTIDSRVEEYKVLAKTRLQGAKSQLYRGAVSNLTSRFSQLQVLEKLLSTATVDSTQSQPAAEIPPLRLTGNKETDIAPCQDPAAPQQPPTPREGEETPVTSPRVTEDTERPRSGSDSSAQLSTVAEVCDVEERVRTRLAKRALGQSYSLEIDSNRVSKRQKLVKSYAKSYK